MTAHKLFKLWFEDPLPKLESSPENAFLAFMASFALFERFIKSKLKKDTGSATKDEFEAEATRVLSLTDPNLFPQFWDMYRNGIAHFLQPKLLKKDGLRLAWEIDANFGEVPEYFYRKTKNDWVIRISPWKWSKFTLALWKTRPDVLDYLAQFPFGEIYEEEA
jgi:hypothetical protein